MTQRRMYQKVCLRCGNVFKGNRSDAQFCTDACAAAWAREQGYERTRFHAEKDENNGTPCQQCGNFFFFNEYADRGGKRQPLYCSPKCRQAAYRARKGYGSSDIPKGEARNDRTQGKSWSGSDGASKKSTDGKGTSQGQDGKKGTSQAPKQNKGTSHSVPPRWSSKDPYEVLGVLRTSKIESIKKAWRKLLTEWHPDRNKDPQATHISQRINWAWATIEKSYR